MSCIQVLCVCALFDQFLMSEWCKIVFGTVLGVLNVRLKLASVVECLHMLLREFHSRKVDGK